MALLIRQAAPPEGVSWMRNGFRLFWRRPLPFAAMFVGFLLAALLATLVPVLGGIAMLMSLPLLTLGFMLGSRAALDDRPVHPGLFIEPLREPGRRKILLTLCALYALCSVLIMTLSEWVDGGSFERLQQLMAKGEEAQAELEAVLADPRLSGGLIVRFGLAACLSVPFWHAPALVYWQGQSVAQSLFSSTLAVWRCKGAFLMYSLAWAGVIAAFGAVVGLLFGLFGARPLAGLVAMPAGLLFSTVFYVSLLYTYEGCFSAGDGPRPLPLPQ